MYLGDVANKVVKLALVATESSCVAVAEASTNWVESRG